jgi:holliday junction DNA helicase RuvA
MIAYLKGIIALKTSENIIVEVAGIGYRVYFYQQDFVLLGQEVQIYTYQKVSEDDISLFGFLDQPTYHFFVKLISVKGIGTRSAMNILRSSSLTQLLNAIEEGNIDFLRSISGVGNKSASQIILDLKGKLDFSTSESKHSSIWNEVADTLRSLGYKQNEINQLGKNIKDHLDNMDLETALKFVLQQLAKKGKI